MLRPLGKCRLERGSSSNHSELGWGQRMNKTWLAIHREASLAAEHLASGATLLGKANYAQQAYYYQAFFALSVGLERSAKLALAVDHRLRTGAFPSEQELRKFGHNLAELLSRMDEMALARRLSGDWAVRPRKPINDAIVSVLTDFASNVTRYYNLDLITGSSRIASTDPLKSWHEQVFIPTANLHYSAKRRERDQANATALAERIGGVTFVRFSSETGDFLTDVASASSMTGMTEAVRPHVRMYVLQLARFVSVVMSDLGRSAQSQGCEDIPYLFEYFTIFYTDDASFRSRVTWSIHHA